jgi:hypothetical protein
MVFNSSFIIQLSSFPFLCASVAIIFDTFFNLLLEEIQSWMR